MPNTQQKPTNNFDQIELLKQVLFVDGPLLSLDKFLMSFDEANAERIQNAGKAINYMFENPSPQSIDNALAHIANIYTLGAVEVVNGAINPADLGLHNTLRIYRRHF